MYAFRIYASNGAFIAELERPYNFFRITDIAYAYSSIYTVKVRIKQGIGMFGEYGTICSIETPKDAIKRETISVAAHSVLSAYPNPFTTAFTITPLEGETATLFYQVYDVTGKMLESRSVEASEVTNHTIGADYPVGMYLVIARQGATTQTFKMIKQ
ncbi:MAG: T9SS type A sorting domain-containing protein [Flavobacterium sp.]|uniref:T9SS type A sorting domain-containing protein n=1 Tax=Flavobacterium sp. TaxID=239 RepID=UPI002B46C001|nr:T9SS type A sorting domain-containing protein [Flavobacterium sp.]WRH72859.1 MAG: T9SS type A sorting domain-containing protein [Flavobacterium sp.]